MLKNKFLTYSILSGILIGTSFIPFPPWASVFAFVPLWHLWANTNSTKKIFWSGWITQFVLTLIGFNWIIITIHDFGNMPWIVAALGLIAFCSFTTIYIPIAGVLYSFINKRLSLSMAQKVCLMAVLLSLLEPVITTIFPWNFGYTWMYSSLPLYQTAEVIGFEGLSTITIWLNVLAYFFFFHPKKDVYKIISPLLIVFCLSTLTVWGYFLKTRLSQPDREINVSIIQANIGDLAKQYRLRGPGFRRGIVQDYLKLTLDENELNAPDFLIWPETAAPIKVGPNSFNTNNNFFVSQLKNNSLSLIAGAYTVAKNGKTQNSMVFYNQGEFKDITYSKTHLLAFGEYIPGSKIFPVFKQWLPQISDFNPGKGPRVSEFKGVKFGPQICYESLFPEFTRSLANKGAEVIINLTNDSWYGDYMEPKQHLYMTLARAIESRRPLIRSTNTGISTVVLANGDILEQSLMSQVWTQNYDVPYKKNPSITFYNQFPYLILIFKLLFLAAIILLSLRRKK